MPKQDDVILSDAPGSDAPNGTLRGEEKFHDPSTSLPPPAAAQEVERAPTPPPLRPTGTTVDDGKTFAEKLIESQFVQSTLELEVTQKLFKTYDGVAEKFGAPNVEKVWILSKPRFFCIQSYHSSIPFLLFSFSSITNLDW